MSRVRPAPPSSRTRTATVSERLPLSEPVRHLPEEPGLRGLVSDAAGADPAEVEVWREGQPVPVAIQRLIDEVRNDSGVPRSYDRTHNRHNRS